MLVLPAPVKPVTRVWRVRCFSLMVMLPPRWKRPSSTSSAAAPAGRGPGSKSGGDWRTAMPGTPPRTLMGRRNRAAAPLAPARWTSRFLSGLARSVRQGTWVNWL